MAGVKRFDHLILAIRDAADAARSWEEKLGLRAGAPSRMPGSNLELVRLPAGGSFLELAEPQTPDHRVARFIEERGEGMFSIALEVEDIDAFVRRLRQRGVRVSRIESRSWEGTRVARINRRSTHGVSIQLIQRS